MRQDAINLPDLDSTTTTMPLLEAFSTILRANRTDYRYTRRGFAKGGPAASQCCAYRSVGEEASVLLRLAKWQNVLTKYPDLKMTAAESRVFDRQLKACKL